MRITILGAGPASGVPAVASGWGRCDPNNPKNRRLRPSLLIEPKGLKILVDTSPDLRQQLLDNHIRHLDAVFFTHAHADHIAGLDDLREINRITKVPLPLFGDAHTLERIRRRFEYAFSPLAPGALSIYKPMLEPHPIEIGKNFNFRQLSVAAFAQDHGWEETVGFRIGDFAYSTDLVELPQAARAALKGVHTWVVGCFHREAHPTHAHLPKVLEWGREIAPKRLVLTHMGVSLDYETLCLELPEWAEPGFDGMVIETPEP